MSKMMLKASAIGVAAALAATSTALADPVLAKLQTSLPGASKPVAGGAVFECLGDVCAARSPSADTASIRGCKDLARQVGPVSSYGAAAKTLAPGEIANCNEAGRK